MNKVSKLLQVIRESNKPSLKTPDTKSGLIFYTGERPSSTSTIQLAAITPKTCYGVRVTTANYLRDGKPVISADASIIPFLSGYYGAFNANESIVAMSRFAAGQQVYMKRAVKKELMDYSNRKD